MKAKTNSNTGSILSVLVLLGALLLPAYNVFAVDSGIVYAYGTDTVAGYSALLSTSKVKSNESVYFYVDKPDGAKVKIPATTNENGVAKVDLYDYHTKIAGEYAVSASYANLNVISPKSYFTVYADAFSADVSKLVANSGVAVADGTDDVYITAQIKDKYGNPLQGHTVTLISSRASDNIECKSLGYLTDRNGSITYAVSSSEKGVSSYTAVDSTSGQAVTERVKVAYLDVNSYLTNAGGDLKSLFNVANAAGSLHHFAFSDIPSEIIPNQDISFTVTAKDIDEQTVENYLGEIHFSADSEYVSLPDDYEFQAGEAGTHTFSLGLSFSTDGTYKITATDLSNPAIKGETTVIVGSESTTTTTTTGALSLLTPVSGTYSQAVQTVSGKSPANAKIKIFDNDVEIGQTQADTSGNYSYQTASLADGSHEIYVTSLDSSDVVTGTSDAVTITIDTKAPTVDEIEFLPGSTANAGGSVELRVTSESGLSTAAIIFNNEIFELAPLPAQPSVYATTLTVPPNPGAYDVDVVLVDELGNEQTYAGEITLTVVAAGEEIPETPSETPEETPTEEPPPVLDGENVPPSQVFGVIAYGSNERVTLVWEAATDDVMVDHYKIYYSADPDTINENAVETNDASTTWYVPGLENGTEYYFALSAIDNFGVESVTKSEIVSGIPFNLELETEIPERAAGEVTPGTEEEELLRSAAAETIPEMAKNGPELIWLLAGTGVFSGFARYFSKKKKGKQI